MHVTFSFELRGALQTMQVDNDQPFSDFRSAQLCFFALLYSAVDPPPPQPSSPSPPGSYSLLGLVVVSILWQIYQTRNHWHLRANRFVAVQHLCLSALF
jgi:hypothetical protein